MKKYKKQLRKNVLKLISAKNAFITKLKIQSKKNALKKKLKLSIKLLSMKQEFIRKDALIRIIIIVDGNVHMILKKSLNYSVRQQNAFSVTIQKVSLI